MITFNSAIRVCERSGRWEWALELLEQVTWPGGGKKQVRVCKFFCFLVFLFFLVYLKGSFPSLRVSWFCFSGDFLFWALLKGLLGDYVLFV